MTAEERQQLRTELVRGGFWHADEARDPATDPGASAALVDVMKRSLAPGTHLSYCVSLGNTPSSEMFINQGGEKYSLAESDDLYVAICLAALALAEFLKQHPGWAASANSLALSQ